MSAQLLEVQQETIPALENTKWTMYDIKNNRLVMNEAIWHFTNQYNIHDEPEIWDGHWSKVDDNKILINCKNVTPPYSEYKYDTIFVASDVFIAFGSDENPNRILIGVKVKQETVHSLENANWTIHEKITDFKE